MNDEMNEVLEDDDIEATGEDNVDDIELSDTEEQTTDTIKKLKTKLKTCESEKSEHLENLQRAKAEFLNSKKRLDEQAARSLDKITNIHILKLLPLLDSFQMAMSNTEVWEATDDVWRKGMESIYNQLQTIINDYGAEEIRPINETFDPKSHEAVSTADAEDGVKSETVVEVLQCGYKRNGELIRPAKVILSN